MSVYVDSAFLPFRRMLMSHLIADSRKELDEMADIIGVDRKWFQGCASMPHYDICKSKRLEAIEAGAILLDNRGMAKRMRKIRKKIDKGKWE